MEVEQHAVILVGTAADRGPSAAMRALSDSTMATFIFYADTRRSVRYPPSIRPHLLAKYFTQFPDKIKIPFLYHDQDIIFLEKPKLDRLVPGDTCYTAAAAKSYLEVKEHLSKFKKKYLLPCMCGIVGVEEKTVKKNDSSAGGAQYVIKGMKAAFWRKCERDCEMLFNFLSDNSSENAWTADMWVLLWNLWNKGVSVVHAAEIDFCWPTDKWTDSRPVMHNAGITPGNETDGKGNMKFFNKSRYAWHSPLNDRFDYVPGEYTQHRYVEYLHRAKNLVNNRV